MANSKLLKEAIADAKAVRETAIANAKIALEEAFTPQLQSILSKKLQAEMEGEEEEIEEELDSSDIGAGDNDEPSAEASDAHTELGPESEEETAEVGDELEEGEGSIEDPTNADDATISEEEEMESDEEEVEEGYHEEEEMEMDEEMEDEDELDLESIIRELEMGMEDEEEVSEEEDMDSEEEMHEEEDEIEEDEMEMDSEEEAEEAEEEDEMDDEIDLDEILREMGYGDDEEVEEGYHEGEEEDSMDEKYHEMEKDLEEAYATIKTLQGTINEVNLLNAKLLYANRLFRSYNLNNEQKTKVVENLDRTSSVREVKLVYATLAESMNFTGAEKKTKKVVSEGASKPVASTAPAKEIISENTNELANRFKQLANIK
jgi:hypothetical protein